MKRNIVLLCSFVLLMSLHSQAQTFLDSIDINDLYAGSIESILQELSRNSGVQFFYDKQDLDNEKTIVERPEHVSLNNFLQSLCRMQKLKFVIEKNKSVRLYNKKRDLNAISEQSNQASIKDLLLHTKITKNFTLSGFIKDKYSGETLPYATLKIIGTTNTTKTNASGFFTLHKVPSDTASLLLDYIGYQKTIIHLLPQYSKVDLTLDMEPEQDKLLAEIVVVKERDDLMQINKNEGLSMIKMTPRQMNFLPSIGEKDLMRSFQLMPGIAASNESSSGLFVRGGTPDQNLVLYDGFTVYQVDHLYGFFSAFNSNALKDIQLYKGGYESRFGGRLSSVVEITGKDGDEKKFNIGGDVSLLGANIFIEAPLSDKITFLVAGRRSYQGLVYNKIFEKFNTNNTTIPVLQGPSGSDLQTKASTYFYDINSKLSFKASKKDIIAWSIFNGTDNLDNGFDFTPSVPAGATIVGGGGFNLKNTDLTYYGNTGTSIKWNRTWTNKLFSSAIVSYSYYFSNRDKTNAITNTKPDGTKENIKFGIIENNKLQDLSFNNDYTYTANENHQFGLGVFHTQFYTNYQYSQNDTMSILNKKENASLSGIYVQDKINIFKTKLQIIPGIRLNYFGVNNQIYVEPRLNVTYFVSKKFSIRASTGQFYQFVNRILREDILTGSKEFWLLSNNTNLPVSSAQHYIAGASYETKNFLFSAEAYYKTLQNLSEYSLRFQASRNGINYEENFFQGIGYTRGIEFLAQKKRGNLNGWVSYTLGEARNKFEIYATSYFPASQDVRHEFKAVALYKLGHFNFSATWVYVSGKPYAAPAASYSVELLDGTKSDYFSVSDKNSLRLPAYHRMDVAVSYNFYSQELKRDWGGINISLFNLYDRTNIWYKQFSIVKTKIIETDITFLGITPNITLTLKLH